MLRLVVPFSIGSLALCTTTSFQAQTVEVRRFVSPDGSTFDQLGHATARSGDRILVGAWADGDQGAASGSAYFFERDSAGAWQMSKWHASDGEVSYYFGYAVALEGDLALVGAPRADEPVDYSGAVYVFERDAGGIWHETHKLEVGLPAQGFGYEILLQGSHAYIGGSGAGPAGIVFEFERDPLGEWHEIGRMS